MQIRRYEGRVLTLCSRRVVTMSYSKKRFTMKKAFIILAATVALASSAFAHHMAEYEDAGIYIPEFSPHLLMEF